MSLRATAERWGILRVFPTALRLLFLADLVTALGIGLTQPYLVVLLHEVKAVPLVTATAMLSLLALVSFPGNWLSGWLADRVGGHRAMLIGFSLAALALVTVASGQGVPVLALGVAGVGFGASITLPAYSTLIASLVPEAERSRAFTFQYALFNAGMAVGAAGGALVTTHGVNGRLTLLWWVAAGTSVLGAVFVVGSRSSQRSQNSGGGQVPQRPEADSGAEPPDGGYRAVFADRRLLRVLFAALLASAAGYGIFNAGLPVLAIDLGDPAVMSWVGVANAVTVVAGLPLALNLTSRLRPPQLLAVTGFVWSVGWVLCAVHGALPFGTRVTLPLAGALIGAGELCLAGALPDMVNALAPEALRGRYNATLTMALTSGQFAGPVLVAGTARLGPIWLLFVVAVALLAVMVLVVQGGWLKRSDEHEVTHATLAPQAALSKENG